MTRKVMVMAAMALFVVTGLGFAQVVALEGNRPASLLIYPLIQKTANSDTLVAITNTNTNNAVVPGTFPPNEVKVGDVQVIWKILWSLGGPNPRWEVTDGKVRLSPGDTFCFLASSIGPLPVGAQGWMYAYADDLDGGGPIDFDFLTGEEIAVGADPSTYLFSLLAFPFKSWVGQFAPPPPNPARNLQGWAFTDVNGNRNLDFDGREYFAFPQELYQPMYLDQGLVPGVLADELVLLLGRGDGGDIRTTVAGNVWDNRENPFSFRYDFDCWTRTAIRNLNPNVVFRLPRQQNNGAVEGYTGWINVRGDSGVNRVTGAPVANVPILGAYIHRADVGGVSFTAGSLLWWDGIRGGAFLPR